ncbi:MAG: hypothetical protein EHM46_01005 [Bacteroidetes bacterium]|nr:MAG: hypothetical protein EHM46_01005 [Bacteroidota bacterium]
MRLCYPVLLLVSLFRISAQAQPLGWNAGFDGFLDNREYYSINNPKTIFGSRTWGEIGADLEDGHRFRAGINYLYEFGYHATAHFPDPILYYQYEARGIDFLIGAFPRGNLPGFPPVFLSDTLDYYRPNIEGTLLGYTGEFWRQHVFIDWTSRQADDRPERFIFGITGNVHCGIFFLEDHFMMAHLAGKGIPDPGHHLRDNGGFNINLGLDLTDRTFLDSLVLRLGSLVSLDRTRGIDPGWQTPAGYIGQLDLNYGFIGLKGLYYRGDGHTFFYGDPFYRLGNYGRLDLYYMPFRKENVSLKIGIALHFAEGELDYSQQILLSARVFR